jgi:predicted amidohydrolase
MIRIGLAQARQSTVMADNAATIMRFLEEAATKGVKILCFPESQTTSYRVDVLTPEAPVQAQELAALHQTLARRCGELGIACILGSETPHPDHPETRPYNSAVVISEQGQILGVHHKTRLTPLDAVAYSPGAGFSVFELHGVKVGVVICFEGFRFADTTRACVALGAQVVFHPQNNTTRPNDWKIPVHHAMIVTRAAENTVWFASCNCCYPDHQNCASMVVAPDGQILAQAQLRREELVVADIDPTKATHAMFNFDRDGCADMLFGTSVSTQEFASAGPMKRA